MGSVQQETHPKLINEGGNVCVESKKKNLSL